MGEFIYPTLECAGKDALVILEKLRREGQDQGFYPILIGDSNDAKALAESLEMNQGTPASIIDAALKINIEDFLKRREEDNPGLIEDLEIGTWPDPAPRQGLMTHLDMESGKPKPKVLIAKIPTLWSYEVPAYLRYGAWNECPTPEEHVAMQKYWNEKYGAEIIATTGDIIECQVSRPPVGSEASMVLAREQFLYCTDIVFQGVETLSALAASLESQDSWFFWWD